MSLYAGVFKLKRTFNFKVFSQSVLALLILNEKCRTEKETEREREREREKRREVK